MLTAFQKQMIARQAAIIRSQDAARIMIEARNESRSITINCVIILGALAIVLTLFWK